MGRLKWLIVKLLRTLVWWLKCLWAGRVVPRVLPGGLYSRSYMRKAWRERLRELDRRVNEARLVWRYGRGEKKSDAILNIQWLLAERRVVVAKRRAYRFE